MTTQEIKAYEDTKINAAADVSWAIQWRGPGSCIIRVGARQVAKFNEGFELQSGDVLRIKPAEDMYAYTSTNGVLTIEEVR